MNKTTEALKLSEEAKVIEKMQQDEIIRMAREACAPNQTFNSDEEWVKRFYELAYATGAAHEREACAQIARKASDNYEGAEIAAAIRARSEK